MDAPRQFETRFHPNLDMPDDELIDRYSGHGKKKYEKEPKEPEPPKEEKHPEETHPLGHPHKKTLRERMITKIFAFSLVIVAISIPIIAAISLSPTTNVFLSLLPFLATLVIGIGVTSRGYRAEVLWGVLFAVHLLGYFMLVFANSTLIVQINVGAAITLSALLGIIVVTLCTTLDKEKPKRKRHMVEFKPEKLPEYVQSIEDKAKGLNFAIGRVYRASNGGTKDMRARLRIPREWYNEFYELKDAEYKEQASKAEVLLRKIHDRLKLHAKKESKIFSKKELPNLKNLKRDKSGRSSIIEVLKHNDNDPVEHYYVSAVDFCERILDELKSH